MDNTGAFIPTDLAGLELWLDASDDTTLTLDGSLVTTWADKSASGNDFTQSVTANKPTVVAAAQNGLQGIEFDGVNDYLVKASSSLDGLMGEAFIVYTTDASGDNGKVLFSTNHASESEGGILFWPSADFGVAGFASAGIMESEETESTNRSVASQTTPVDSDTPYIAHLISNGTAWSSNINGISQSLVVSNENNGAWFGDQDRDNTLVGGWVSGGTVVTHFDGRIFEIVIYDNVNLTPQQREKVTGYLATKWNI